MIKLLTFLPAIMSIIKRGLNLAGANSHTTRAQYGVLVSVGVVVAALGYFMPDLANEAVAAALVASIAPLVSRAILYRTKPDTTNDGVMLDRVKYKGDSAHFWSPFDDTMLAARNMGFGIGADVMGNVWDIKTGTMTGEVIAMPANHDIGKGALAEAFKNMGKTLIPRIDSEGNVLDGDGRIVGRLLTPEEMSLSTEPSSIFVGDLDSLRVQDSTSGGVVSGTTKD